MNELVAIEDSNAMALFIEPAGLEPMLNKIREEIDAFVPDIETSKGRKEIASFAAKVAKSKVYLDNHGKRLVAELKQKPKIIDASRKQMRDTLDGWRDEVRKPLTDWEEREAKAKADIFEKLSEIQSMSDGLRELSIESLQESLLCLKGIVVDESYGDKAIAEKLIASSVDLVSSELATKIKHEETEAENAKLRKEVAERDEKDRIEREAREAKEAEEKAQRDQEQAIKDAETTARLKAEQKAKEREQRLIDDAEREKQNARRAEEQAQRDKDEAQRRIDQADARAKQKALEDDAARVEAARQREADVEHKRKVNNSILQALTENNDLLNVEQAKSVISLIVKGLVPNTSINY